MRQPRITAFGPVRPWSPPGSSVELAIGIRAEAAGAATLEVSLLDVARVVERRSTRLRLAAGTVERRLTVALPVARRHGYGLRATLRSGPGDRGTDAWSAVEALDGWWESPRHVALTRFRDAREAPAQVASAARWHVTVAQAYDWMYRHYRYEAPTERFRDALGREVSHDAVRALIREGHARGIATLAYGSVYGAEAEHVAAHPEDRVFDDAGKPASLGGTFFINDLRPGRPWRARLLTEYDRACERFGFDGIHMDTYGPPHEVVATDGERIRFSDLYPGLIAEAAERVAATGSSRRVLFNCVEGYPLDAVATAPAAALYLELWPPDDRYRDVVRWIDHARAAGEGRAVVIAAYVPALRDAGTDPVRRAAAVETAVLLTTVITAAGASHHALAEDDRVLVEGYYPTAVRLRAAEARELRAAWLFGARYLHLLSDPAAVALDVTGLELRDREGRAVPVAASPEAGAVWARATATPHGRVLSLVDLRAQDDDRWTAERQPMARVSGWMVRWPDTGPSVRSVTHRATPVAMSPWTGSGAAVRLPTIRVAAGGAGWRRLPAFRRWLLVHEPNGAERRQRR